jgi:hypothetical protein
MACDSAEWTAFEDGTHRLQDPDLLDQSIARGRVLYTNDVDLVVEARRRQHTGQPFAGVIYAQQGSLGIGHQIEELELAAKATEPEELANTLLFLPLH